tara:strand:+ start:4806 stop:5075 length:270 start_codon:yes stop_codon:yes gene_type:complete
MIKEEFLTLNKDKLKNIYIKERILNYGEFGALFIDFCKSDNADVYFLTLNNMPENVKVKFENKNNLQQQNTIFLYVFDNTQSYIMDVLV